MSQQRFTEMYEGRPPWDTGQPQPAIVRLAEAGRIHGSVLDAGCGTGENALYLAARGHECWGIDFVPAAIERAQAKAAQRGVDVHFAVGDALQLDQLGRQFDTVIDCGLLHTFADDQRSVYVAGLAKVLRPGGAVHILCFSTDEPGTVGPRRISQQEIRDAFRNGWQVQQVTPTRFAEADRPEGPIHSPGGPHAWLATIERA